MHMENRQFVIRYGLSAFAGIAAFFLAMKLVGLEDVAWLRIFNLVIVIYMTIRLAKRLFYLHGKLEYVDGLGSLFVANAIAVVLSLLGLGIYVWLIDPQFVYTVQSGSLWSPNLGLSSMVMHLFMEGMAGSVIISFATMQYWKDLKIGSDMRIHKQDSAESAKSGS